MTDVQTYTVLLDYNVDRTGVESEEKLKFIRSILEALDVEVDSEVWPEPPETSLTLENKIKLRQQLSSLGLIILEQSDGSLEVYHDNQMIGEWKQPFYVLKTDPSQIDPKKKLYLEMHVSFSSPLFETST